MFTMKSAAISIALAMAMHATASASLLEPREYEDGALTWLELSETTGLSMDDIENGIGGWSQHYRFATEAEIRNLLNNIGLYATDYHLMPASNIRGFVFGVGGSGAPGGTWEWGGNQGAAGQGMGAYVDVGMTSGDSPSALSEDCPAYTSCSYAFLYFGTTYRTSRSDSVGNFLVRVPEPATLGLFGLAGALLLARWQRNKSSPCPAPRIPNVRT